MFRSRHAAGLADNHDLARELFPASDQTQQVGAGGGGPAARIAPIPAETVLTGRQDSGGKLTHTPSSEIEDGEVHGEIVGIEYA